MRRGKGGEGSRIRPHLICCVGFLVYPTNGHMRITAGLRIAPPVGRCLGLGPSLALSRRLLKGRSTTAVPSRVCPCAQPSACSRRLLAQSPRPRYGFVNPRAVIRNGRFGEKCLPAWAAEAKPEPTWSSPLEMEEITQDHPKETNSSPLNLKMGVLPSSRLLLVRQITPHPMPQRQLSGSEPGSQT